MDAATQAAWETSVFAKCLRDAQAANDALREASQLRLWNDGALWFEPDTDERISRPTEYAALRRVFFGCSNGASIWSEWLDQRDAARYAGELDQLAERVEVLTVENEAKARKAAQRAELASIRASQAPLPFPAVA